MTLSNMTSFIIIIHAALGGISLLSGMIASLVTKGSEHHKMAGRIFYYAGVLAISLCFLVICFPGHWNPFLLTIGIFSLYFLIIGFRSRRYQLLSHSFFVDKVWTWVMATCCVAMIVVPIILFQTINIVTAVFGLLGLTISFRNLFAFAEAKHIRIAWLRFHIIHMSAGLISMVSAFMVVNNFLPSLFNWFLPTIIGTILISLSLKKYTKTSSKLTVNNAILILIFCSWSILINAQDHEKIKNRDLTLKIGLSKAQLQDSRLSGKTHQSWSPKYSISHIEVKENSRNHFQVDFVSMKFGKSGQPFGIRSIHSNVHFAYQRKIADGTWFGGYINTLTLINFPKNPGQTFFVNNPVSYTLSKSIGPSVTYSPGFDNHLNMASTVQAAALSYVVQPIYGHPYPEKYMEEGVFSPTQKNMVGPLIRSGKFLSFKKFRHMNIQLSVFYAFDNNFKMGIDYNYSNYMANANGKAVKMKNQDIFLTTGLFY
jgi:hypothetical protein